MDTNVTRRSFLRLATDTLLTMPAVVGGALAVSPATILAAEDEDGWSIDDYTSEEDGGSFCTEGHTNEVEIIALKPSEVGFRVLDMSTKENKPIPGAHIKLTSLYNQKVVEADTDAKGTVVFDVAELSEKPNSETNSGKYAFNAAVEVSAKGYRDFASGVMRVEGNQGHYVPTRAITDGKPYPSTVSFNRWDVLYQENLFTMGKKNTSKYPLFVRIKNIKGDGPVELSLIEREGAKVLASATADAKDGVAEATIERSFLQQGGSEALPLDKQFSLRFSVAGAGYEFPIALKLEEAPFDEPGEIKDMTASPLGTKAASGFEVKWPSNSPLGGKGSDSFSAWIPEFPINLYYDPKGAVQIMVKTPSWGYVDDTGLPADKTGWGKYPRKSLADQLEKKIGDMGKLLDKTGAAMSRDGVMRQIDFSAQIRATANLQFVGILQWDRDKSHFSGNAAAQAVLALDTSFTEQFFAGPFPLFIMFAFKMSAAFSLGVGMVVDPPEDGKKHDLTKVLQDTSNYHWDFTNTGFTFTLLISPSLSLGLGIKGIASVSLRGSCTITFFIGMTKRGDLKEATHPLPHLILGYQFSADVVVEIFLFTKTWNLGTFKDPNWYNNWKGGESKGLSAQTDGLTAMAPTSMSDFLEGMTPVTDEMLRSTVEYRKTADGKIKAQAEDGTPYEPVLIEEYVEGAMMTEDGEPVACTIFRYAMPGETVPGTADETAEGADPEAAEGPEDAAAGTAAEGAEDAAAGTAAEGAEGAAPETPEGAEGVPPETPEATAGAPADATVNPGSGSEMAPEATAGAATDATVSPDSGSEVAPDVVAEPVAEGGADSAVSAVDAVIAQAAVGVVATQAAVLDAVPAEGGTEAAVLVALEDGSSATVPEVVSGDASAVATEGSLGGAEAATSRILEESPSSTVPEVVPGDADAPLPEVGATGATDGQEAGDLPAMAEDTPVQETSAPEGAATADEGATGERATDEITADETTADEATADEGATDEAATDEAATAEEPTVAASPFVFTMPEYEPLFEETEGLTALADDAMTVVGIGKRGGVRPGSDTLLLNRAKDKATTFGNPRPLVVQITDTEAVLLRLGTVDINGQPRTRLIATVAESKLRAVGTSQVLDFPIYSHSRVYQDADMKDLKRDDLYDYDFDAVVLHSKWDGGSADRVNVAFISGRRNFKSGQTNAQKLASAATDLVLSHVVFEFNTSAGGTIFKGDPGKIFPMSLPGRAFLGQTWGATNFHSISNVQLNHATDWRSNSTYVISFLIRSGSTPEQALGDGGTTHLGMVFVDGIYNQEGIVGYIQSPSQETISKQVGDLESSAYELVLWPSVDGYATLMVRGHARADYFVMHAYYTEPAPNEGRLNWGFTRVKTPDLAAQADGEPGDSRLRLNDWKVVDAPKGGKQQQFLASKGGKLVSALVSDHTGKSPELTFSDIGPSNFSLSSFGAWGDFIYWPELRDGSDGFRVNKDGEPYEKKGVKESRIMGARLRDGKFSDPFVIADLDHYVDNIVSVSGTKAALAIVTSEMVDSSKDAGLLWRTAVPFVRTITAIGAEAPNAFVSPGQNAEFHITLRNDGNTFLTGCEVVMYEGSKEVAKNTLKFGKDTLLESTYNPSDGKGGLQNAESDYALAPGKTSVYKIGMLIPQGWHGNYKVSFVGNAKPELSAQAEDVYVVDYVAEPGEIPMDVIAVEAYAADDVSINDAPVTVQNGSSPTKPSGESAKKSTLPDTSDTGAASPLAAAGLAAAGAAVLAYERRRARNERSE